MTYDLHACMHIQLFPFLNVTNHILHRVLNAREAQHDPDLPLKVRCTLPCCAAVGSVLDHGGEITWGNLKHHFFTAKHKDNLSDRNGKSKSRQRLHQALESAKTQELALRYRALEVALTVLGGGGSFLLAAKVGLMLARLDTKGTKFMSATSIKAAVLALSLAILERVRNALSVRFAASVLFDGSMTISSVPVLIAYVRAPAKDGTAAEEQYGALVQLSGHSAKDHVIALNIIAAMLGLRLDVELNAAPAPTARRITKQEFDAARQERHAERTNPGTVATPERMEELQKIIVAYTDQVNNSAHCCTFKTSTDIVADIKL